MFPILIGVIIICLEKFFSAVLLILEIGATDQGRIRSRGLVTDSVKISKEVEMRWDAGKGLAPMDKGGDDGA